MPPQFKRPAFWISTAPRPPARFAPQATATASSSRATSTTLMADERRTSSTSLPIQVSGTEAARVTPALSRPATICRAPVISAPASRGGHVSRNERHEGLGGQMQQERAAGNEAGGRGLGDKGQEPLTADNLRGHLGLKSLVGHTDD